MKTALYHVKFYVRHKGKDKFVVSFDDIEAKDHIEAKEIANKKFAHEVTYGQTVILKRTKSEKCKTI